jgi:urocanate hydratase
MRHADAGYEEAVKVAKTRKLDLPMITRARGAKAPPLKKLRRKL